MTPTELYEREDELASLGEALACAREGRGRLVILEGSPGVGKTRLLEAARESARAAGMAVLSARGTELEREFPFGAARQLFEEVLANAGEADRAVLLAGSATFAAALFPGVGSIPPNAASHAITHGLFWLTANVAEAGPLVIAVDDAQWCDAGSRDFLGYLAARLDDLSVALILAVRSGDPGTPETLSQLRAQSLAERLLRPAPLSQAGVESLTRAAFPQATEEFAQACGRASGGNPFLLGELLRSLREDAVSPGADAAAAIEQTVPESVLSSVLARLAHLSADAVALAGAAAVLGDGASLAHAAALADLPLPAAEIAADSLASARILRTGEPISFTHPLIASAVEADLPGFGAARAHRRAAAMLAAEGAPVEAVGSHLLRCRGEGEEWAVEALRAAAEHAGTRGDPAAAAKLLTRALEEPPDPERGPALLLALASAETAAGGAGAPERMTEALAQMEDPRDRAQAHRANAQLLLARARYEEAADALQAGLGDVSPGDPLAELLLADLLGTWFFVPGRRAAADPRLASLVECARAGDIPSGPSVLAPLAATLACEGKSVELVRPLAESSLAALTDSSETSHGVLSAFTIAALLFVDELDLAERALGLARERARAHGSEVAYAIACHWQARVDFRRGRLPESVASAQQALELGRSGGWTAAILAEAQIEQGELDRAAETIELIEAADRGGIEHGFLLQARGRLELARGDDASGLEDLLAAGRHFREQYDFDNPIMLGWREPAALASVRLGAAADAIGLAEAALQRARALGSEGAHGSALRALGLATGGERGIELLSEATAALDSSPARLEYAGSLVDLGGAMRRAGQTVAAREPLRSGLELAERCGAAPLAERAREELRGAGARPRRAAISGVDSLTPSELRVAELAAGGLTNKQIAQALFVTSKTVESHLRQAFRKLGLRSREDLPAALAR